MDKKIYATKQQQQLMLFFRKNQQQSFSANYLINEAELNMGEATIYRLLNKLTQQKLLVKIPSTQGHGSQYQYNLLMNCGNHFHLQCLDCGHVVCMNCSVLKQIERHLSHDHSFILDSSHTMLYGLCKHCTTPNLTTQHP